jgi:hypothetical protein
VRANSFFESFYFPAYGLYELIKPPQRLGELGQHNEELLLELGYSREDITILREQKVIV